MTEIFTSPDPRKAYGKALLDKIAHTILATDWKSPPFVIYEYPS